MSWPIYFKNKLHLGNLESPVALCTLWTPKEKVIEQLDRNSFCVAGQLYSCRGLNFIVRNLLAKPSIQYIIVCGKSLTGTDAAIVDFFKEGKAKEGNIDPQIPPNALNELRESVEVIDLSGDLDSAKVQSTVSSLKPREEARKSQTFPEPPSGDEESFPTDPSLFKIRGDYIGEVWLRALKHILKFGQEQARIGGQKVKSIHNLAAVVEEEDPRGPQVFPYFNFDLADVETYIENFFSKELSGHSYSYGARLQNYRGVDQIRIMKDKLARFSGEEGALAVLWDPTVDNFPPPGTSSDDEVASFKDKNTIASFKDKSAIASFSSRSEDKKHLGKTEKWNVPCLNLIQAQVYGGKLFLTACFRAHDVFNAWPRNLFALRELQCQLIGETDYELGLLTVFSQFAWVSKNDLPLAKGIVDENYKQLCEWDPRGNFVIEVEKNKIIAVHLSPEGKKLQEFSVDGKEPKAAVKLCGEIISELAVSDLNHAADLGRELAKAETAVKNNLVYKQDSPLKL